MKPFKIILAAIFGYCTFTNHVLAQADSSSTLAVTGYLESYYSYDFGAPDNHDRPGFLYSHNRHNELNINLAFLKAAYASSRVRANLAVMAGTYANANLSAEPGVLKNIFEANAGVRLSKKSDLWLDAGVFASHIGFESAISKDCWTLTRSILADNSPYYESGIKLGYTSPGGRWFFSALVLNGWQHIQRPYGNQTPAFGHQITFKPNAKVTLNSSSFIGNDKIDTLNQMRYFHNFYGIFQLNQKIGLTLGFDFGLEKAPGNVDNFNKWYSPVVILKVNPSNRFSMAFRGEYYSDENGVIIATGTRNGFKTFGYSINADYNIQANVMWRLEFRGLHSEDEIFFDKQKPSKNNLAITTSIAISF